MFTRLRDEERVAPGLGQASRAAGRPAPATSIGGRVTRSAIPSRLGRRASTASGSRWPSEADDRAGRHRRDDATCAATARGRSGSRGAARRPARRTRRARRGSPRSSGVNAPGLMTMAAQRPRARVDRVDQLALVVRLHVLEREAVPRPRPLGRGDVVGERVRAVDLRLALPEQVEVRPVQQQHESTRHASGPSHGASAAAPPPRSTPAHELDAVAGRRARRSPVDAPSCRGP